MLILLLIMGGFGVWFGLPWLERKIGKATWFGLGALIVCCFAAFPVAIMGVLALDTIAIINLREIHR